MQKKTYTRPVLRRHGAVEGVTLGMTGSFADMATMMAMAMA